MKQTSSALTFLMAQYRAIFKRAYVKGIATAVLLTAGLAAGAAQADNNLYTDWQSGGAIKTETANDSFKVKSQTIVNGITIGDSSHKLTTSGSIISTDDMTSSGGLVIEKGGQILLGDKKENQVVYNYDFTSNGGDIEMAGNIGAASFSISGGTLVLTSGGADNTNLTAYGNGWIQGKTEEEAIDYNRTTANGNLSHMNKITVNSGTNIAALHHLTINDVLNITLSGGGSGSGSGEGVKSGDTAYLEGSHYLDISDSTINVSGYANGIFSKNGSISNSDINISKNAKLLIAGNADNYTAVLSGSAASGGTYSLTNTDITNEGTLQLGTTAADSFTITDGSMNNTGTVIVNADKLSVTDKYFNGFFNGEGGKLNFSGSAIKVDGEVDLNGLGIINSSNGSLVINRLGLKAGGATLTTDTVSLKGFYTADELDLDVSTLNVESTAQVSSDTKKIRFEMNSGTTITVHDALTGSNKIDQFVIKATDEGDTTSLTLDAGANGGVINNINRFNIGWSSKSSGSSQLIVDGNWDFNDARLTVSSGGELTINGTATDVDSLMMQADGKVTIGTNGAMTIQRLLGAEKGTTGSINLSGTLTVTGDGDTSDEGSVIGNNEYANDVQLPLATVNINNGGTFAITGADAVEDIFTVTSGDSGLVIEVAASGSKNEAQGGWDKSKVNLLAGGTLKIDLAAVDPAFTSIDSGDLNKLKGELVKDPSKGSFDFGNINISLREDVAEAISGGSIGYDTLLSGGVNNVQGIDKLEGLTVAVDTSKNSSINLSMGASSVELTGSNKVNVEGSLILASNSADGDHQFVYQAATTPSGSATVADVSVAENSGVNLTGAGTIGSLTKMSSATGTSAVLNAGEGATQTVAGVIDLETVTIGTGTVTVAENITATELNLSGDLVNTAESGANTLTAAKLTQAQGTTLTANKLTLGSTTGSGTESLVQGNIVADTITLEQADNDESNTLTIAGGSTVTSNTFEAASGAQVYVGLDGDNSSAGSLSVTTMDLNGANLIVDPEFGTKASFVGVKGFNDRKNTYEAGMLDGNAYALKNAILSIGDENETNVRALFADYLDADNSLSANGVGAIVYVADNMGVTAGHKIVVDPAAQLDPTEDLDTTNEYKADLTIRNGGALAIDVTAAAKDGVAALNFDKTGAEIEAGTSAKILLTGDYTQYDTLTLFKDRDDGLTFTPDSAQSITVETLNGLLQGTYSGTSGTFDVGSMTLQTERVKTAYTDTSAAVRHSIIAYLAKDANWDERDSKGYKKAPTHGALIGDVIYNPSANNGNGGYTYANGDPLESTVKTDNWMFLGNPDYVSSTETPEEQPNFVYLKPQNAFLDAVAKDTLSGNAADSAAHMAEFGGVAQVALKAGAATTDAIAGRMGMGAQNSAITFANNGQGAGIWVTPIYVSSDSDGFEAQGVDYGTDINLYGVALGGDYTLANGVRIGAMFNVGSGDADGQGAGSAVTSDFDYYGFGLYAGYSVGQFSIVGDVSYTAVDNDVEANTGIDKLETSLDSANLSVGVTGSYAFETAAGVTVTPHVGLRYSYIDIDDYSVKGKTYGTVGDYSADSLSVFSIPVGVTIASEFQAGTWSVKPSFDVTLTGNFGDDEAEGTFHWAGVENIDSSLNSEIFDNFTYGASLGIAAQSTSGISLGVAVGYTGSSNTDDLGVSANARFTF